MENDKQTKAHFLRVKIRTVEKRIAISEENGIITEAERLYVILISLVDELETL